MQNILFFLSTVNDSWSKGRRRVEESTAAGPMHSVVDWQDALQLMCTIAMWGMIAQWSFSRCHSWEYDGGFHLKASSHWNDVVRRSLAHPCMHHQSYDRGIFFWRDINAARTATIFFPPTKSSNFQKIRHAGVIFLQAYVSISWSTKLEGSEIQCHETRNFE